MKPVETKQEFIELRAEGRSFSFISKKLNIAKDTCSKWQADLEAEISERQRLRLIDLYQAYGMTKEARIKRLGSTLEKIDAALDAVDFTKIEPAKLLDYKLKYLTALKGEYVSGKPVLSPDGIEPENLKAALLDLLARIKDGEITPEQAAKESLVITNLLKAYETTDLKAKLDMLEATIGGGGNA